MEYVFIGHTQGRQFYERLISYESDPELNICLDSKVSW